MNKPALVSDTSLLLYLGRIDHTHLMPMLYEPVFVPEPVIWELDTGRISRSDTIDPRRLDWLTRVKVTPSELDRLPANRLGNGELAVLAYGYSHPGCLVGLDERKARLLARELGLRVVGLIGILVRAKQQGLIRLARPLLDAAHKSGFRMSVELYQTAIELAGED